MELEGIGRVAMSRLTLKIAGQVDDCNGIKRTLLWSE